MRLARLNIELNSALVGVRVLFEVIDSPRPNVRHQHAAAEGRYGAAGA